MFIKCFLKCLAKPKRSVIRSLCFTPGSNKADLRHEQRFRFLEYVIYVLLQVLPFLDVLNDHWAYQQGTPQERGAISRWFGHYSCLFWRRRWHPTPVLLPENPMDRGAWWAAVHGVVKSQTRLSDFPFTFTFMLWRRKWQPTPVFLPGESQGWGSLVGCSPWGCEESDTTEAT